MNKTKNKTMKLTVQQIESVEGIQYKRIIWGGSHRYSFSLDDEFICADKDKDADNLLTYHESIMDEKRAIPCVIVYTDMNDKQHYLLIEKYYE